MPGHTNTVPLYYVQDTRQMVGNSMLWWAEGSKGYVCDIRKAKVWTRDEAFAQQRMRGTDRPWPKAYIDRRISHHVDFQHCDREHLSDEQTNVSGSNT